MALTQRGINIPVTGQITNGDDIVNALIAQGMSVDAAFGSLADQIVGEAGEALDAKVAAYTDARLGQVFTPSTNLINIEDLTLNTRYAAGSPTPEPFAGAAVTGYIPLSTQFTTSGAAAGGVGRVSYFDKDKTWLADFSYGVGATTRTPPAGTAYVRFTLVMANMHNAQANLGGTLLDYEPGGGELAPGVRFTVAPGSVDTTAIVAAAVDSAALDDDAVTPAKATFVTPSSNLINLDRLLVDHTIPSGQGTPTPTAPASKANVSDWIEVHPGADYTMTAIVRVVWFTRARTYLANWDADSATALGTAATTRTAPVNAAYARFVIHSDRKPIAQVNLGDQLLDYEPGNRFRYAGLSNAALTDRATGGTVIIDYDDLRFRRGGDRYCVDGDLSGVYSAATVPDQASFINGSTAATVHGWYDALVANYPHMVSRTHLGDDTSVDEWPLYRYDFYSPQPGAVEVNIPTVMVTSGHHGNEQAAVRTLYNFLARMCAADPGADPTLATLRDSVHWVIIPVVNPSGYKAYQRTNHNGVDLNRNYPAGWAAGTPGSPTYGGTSALSEVEAQYVAAVLEDVEPLVAVDFHNFHSNPDPNMFLWVNSGDAWHRNLIAGWLRRMTRKWRDRAWVDDDPTKFVGWVDPSVNGTFGKYAESLDVPGTGTFEHCNKRLADGASTPWDSDTMTQGLEAWVNYLAMLLDALIRD